LSQDIEAHGELVEIDDFIFLFSQRLANQLLFVLDLFECGFHGPQDGRGFDQHFGTAGIDLGLNSQKLGVVGAESLQHL